MKSSAVVLQKINSLRSGTFCEFARCVQVEGSGQRLIPAFWSSAEVKSWYYKGQETSHNLKQGGSSLYSFFSILEYMSQPVPSHQPNYARILSTLRSRRNQTHSYPNAPIQSNWPTSTPFTILNAIRPITPHASASTLSKTRSELTFKESKDNFTQSSAVIINFDRPATTTLLTRKSRMTLKSEKVRTRTREQQTNLFEFVRGEKLLRLEREKGELMEEIFNKRRQEVHRVDQDEEITEKNNAINFKTYYSLNKLMDLTEQIHFTANRRPKTGADRPRSKPTH